MLEVRNYYSCKDYFLLVFPTKDSAIAAMRFNLLKMTEARESTVRYHIPTSWVDSEEAAAAAKFWTQKLGHGETKVANPNDIFYLVDIIKNDEQFYLYCISPKFVGWIIWHSWLLFAEITTKNGQR